MLRLPGALFTDGPLDTILDIVVKAEESEGGASVEDELARYARVADSAGIVDWILPASMVCGLLDFMSGYLEMDEPPVVPPRVFSEKLKLVAGKSSPAEYLNCLSGILRTVARQGAPGYEELPMSAWEARAMFMGLWGFTGNWFEDGEFATLGEAVQAAIYAEHPFCDEYLSRIAADSQRAIVLFPDDVSLKANLRKAVHWVSHRALRSLLKDIDVHMLLRHRGGDA